ncbi:transposable element Tcb1 transposase [Trichonephila clavipes]|nr:transposable element Tcb1 transposase [Trichonephila clavipes]
MIEYCVANIENFRSAGIASRRHLTSLSVEYKTGNHKASLSVFNHLQRRSEVDMPLRRFRRQYEQLSQFERERIISKMEVRWSARREVRQLRPSDCVWRHALGNWTAAEWNQVIFSDESRFNLDSDDNCVRVWRPHGEHFNPAFALQRHTTFTAGIMFTCRNCGGGDRGRVAIYHPFGEVSLSLNRTVTCMVLKANVRRTSCPCHVEFRGSRSDYVRQSSYMYTSGPKVVSSNHSALKFTMVPAPLRHQQFTVEEVDQELNSRL